MITEETYQINWIKNISSKIGKRGDPKMLEKVIYAFTLLEQLRKHGLNLIFKGGTSLLLAIPKPRRFSIDIDIITLEQKATIEEVLSNVIKDNLFTRWESDNDRKHHEDAPVLHYKLFYQSKISSHFGEEPILLDILLSENPYTVVHTVDIAHEWLAQLGDPLQVEVPTLEAILGDKLTAFAPHTTGILYTKNRPVEIIKQLYDIGFLFDLITDISVVRDSYLKVVRKEIEYRKLNSNFEEVLKDTFDTCLMLALRENNEQFNQLQIGINNITNFILDRFKIEDAIVAASKVAYITKLLSSNDNAYEKYQDPTQVKEMEIIHPSFTKLNKLKKSNPEAFYYWVKTISKN
ncbi:MAG: nucleotidyl transferase AbiEii/AbiGii toxin family protein [Cytophagales bacterium]